MDPRSRPEPIEAEYSAFSKILAELNRVVGHMETEAKYLVDSGGFDKLGFAR